ncbi:hypothetical protein [Demequina sp.]|uniref:hypothetical protein n=1 Tax=Demequina sp. TaxID=2050685 RepID=UPI003D1511EE
MRTRVVVAVVIGVTAAVLAVALAVSAALPDNLVIPDGPSSSPMPTMTNRNFLDPAFGWRSAIVVFAAVVTMTGIALVARAVERRRSR